LDELDVPKLLLRQAVLVFLKLTLKNSFGNERHPVADVICKNGGQAREEEVGN
jgi:hypothetical protein